jgi:hypothetical protein
MMRTKGPTDPTQWIEKFIQQTADPIFLTGKAGTGKTTLVRKIVAETHKNVVIVAPTGVAALHAGGVTIHSFFQLPFATFVPDNHGENFDGKVRIESRTTLRHHFKMGRTRQQMIRSLELLIIDEVSMLRADLLDAIDWMLRFVRKREDAFGGLQVLLVGDLLQLPPVVKQEEWGLLQKHYEGMYFFQSKVMAQHPPVYIELTKVYRQQDEHFLSILNNLRNNNIEPYQLELLNEHVKEDFVARGEDSFITLTTHNHKASEINRLKLQEIDSPSLFYQAEITGEFPVHMHPMPDELELKVGAQVLFIKNDPSIDKRFYNGKIGTVHDLNKEMIQVRFPSENKVISVDRYEWNNIRYTYNTDTNEIEEEVLGTFVHFPLRLAWSITVHKSQGLTFDRAILDVADVFAPGQAYVALSRIRSLEGLVLLRPFRMNGLKNDTQVNDFSQKNIHANDKPTRLASGTKEYLLDRLEMAFQWSEIELRWSALEQSANASGPRSLRSKQLPWIRMQVQSLQRTLDPARKFRRQLANMLSGVASVDYLFLHQRVQAAYDYFYPILDNALVNNLIKIKELSIKRNTTELTEELKELDEELTRKIVELKKVRILTEIISLDKALDKETMVTDEIRNYKIAKVAEAQHRHRQKEIFSSETEETSTHIPLVNSPVKQHEFPRSTADKTLEMLEKGLTPEEIASERKLTITTIHHHIEGLIRLEKIEPENLIPEEKVKLLREELKDGWEGSLSKIKEDKRFADFSWEEIRWIRAACIR